ncbi:hypothetical protein Halru_3055 [Halovivax ruber XH-70]|uniref:Uncharacterized protein n=1 Tax=Halovivax ruber (strain DSM 18193 / JCM 13892 / XH-70) TaxID=797302 RepID=L0IHA1_HALRX|nr:hypothetical protein [Halovivax ruber]AGB17621.1 hypothetical protein Halru_3055 [Halovivax ruber XH-70]
MNGLSIPPRPWVTRTRLYHVVGWGLRIYVACLLVVGFYSILWLAEVAGYLDQRTLAVIWLAVAGMGSAFLVLLVPLYYSSRLRS